MPSQLIKETPGRAPVTPRTRTSVSKPHDRTSEPQAALSSVRGYLDGVSPVPEILLIIGEESVRNGTDKLTSEQIDDIIQEARAERRASLERKKKR